MTAATAALALFATGAVLLLLGVALKRADDRICRVANDSHEERR